MSEHTATMQGQKGSISWLICGASMLAVLIVLVGFMPYAAGYLGGRLSLARTLQGMWKQEDWQHCWLVVPVIGVIIYCQRERLLATSIKGSWLGLAIIGISLFFYWAGYAADNYYIGFFSIQILIAGLILWFFGWKWFGQLFFAWFFLIFAWPMLFLDTMLAFPLRMIMSDVAYHILNMLGIPALKIGSAVVSAPDMALNIKEGTKFSIDIANPCSGIRSLFALTMITALYAYFAVKPLWKQIVIFLCAAPLAIVGNLARILILTFGTLMFGADFAIGSLEHPTWFHEMAGYVVFIVALGGMLLIGWILQADWQSIFATIKSAANQNKISAAENTSTTPSKRTHTDDADVY